MPIATHHVWRPSAGDPLPKGKPLWWTAGPAGELAVLFVRRRFLTHTPYLAGWIGWGPRVPFDAVLMVRDADGSVRCLPIEQITMRPGQIGLLPGGRLLIVNGRSTEDENAAWTPNAAVYSPEGKLADSFCVGDDIDVLVTDSAGSLWVAYGDEGIYGGHPESAAGLAGWDERGRHIWSPAGRLPQWPLAGCAAATEDDQVWLAWYSSSAEGDTFLSRITPRTGAVTTWPSPVRAPDGLAVCGDRAVLTRRVHGERFTEVTRARLVQGTWTVTEQERVRVPGRVVLRCGQGREGRLWLRAGRTWLLVEA
ncbi:hypothetical protein [Actinoplanes couchii]|uniref:Uncharacterized protein n=1 Tax=Actinoplanes couchii TaxID=403638 RepID=A0ABQ3X086_9ACTN|nr:hypothetical protein [Actinoplanes couchii]MDR6316258.1 hypothetical protein [Actinoplanes couchii]GID51872.1 hypothetical protein Aco03nite_002760 [Actinoplanes couchii]